WLARLLRGVLGVDDIGDEAFVAGPVLAGEHGGFAHGGMLGEAGLDLPELDAEAADLDLLVVAAEEVEVAVGPIAGEVAGLVEAVAGDERVVEEALGGELGAVQIPARHARSADVDLPHGAERHRLTVPVQEINPRVRNRAANGLRSGRRSVLARDVLERGPNRRFR